MDQDQNKAFGGYCGKVVEESCCRVNSHVNAFGLANYGPNKNCHITLDAGPEEGAR